MLVSGQNFRSIWRNKGSGVIQIIDQRWLPHEFKIVELNNLNDAVNSIKEMWVRGAPLIGVTAAYGMALAIEKNASFETIQSASEELCSARPTAINLYWAVERVKTSLLQIEESDRFQAAIAIADEIAEEDVIANKKIGEYGYQIIKKIAASKTDNSPVRILTHCNAGWLATVDKGTATAPIYEANRKGINLEVWVDETRPRNQGASLTTWELRHNNIPHTLIVDNAGGHLMQKGQVDICIVGSDRTTSTGDVCNKIGTYLKALAAKDNEVPFYAALPKSTIDFSIKDGLTEIPIEERGKGEVLTVQGLNQQGKISDVLISTSDTKAANPAFDVTPRNLITGIITEMGVWDPRLKFPFGND